MSKRRQQLNGSGTIAVRGFIHRNNAFIEHKCNNCLCRLSLDIQTDYFVADLYILYALYGPIGHAHRSSWMQTANTGLGGFFDECLCRIQRHILSHRWKYAILIQPGAFGADSVRTFACHRRAHHQLVVLSRVAYHVLVYNGSSRIILVRSQQHRADSVLITGNDLSGILGAAVLLDDRNVVRRIGGLLSQIPCLSRYSLGIVEPFTAGTGTHPVCEGTGTGRIRADSEVRYVAVHCVAHSQVSHIKLYQLHWIAAGAGRQLVIQRRVACFMVVLYSLLDLVGILVSQHGYALLLLLVGETAVIQYGFDDIVELAHHVLNGLT